MSAHTASIMRRPSMRKITIAGAIGAVKGVCTVSDAKLAVELGADAVILSNHGGRQLDRAVAPIAMVADVRAALGPEVEILVDSGIRSASTSPLRWPVEPNGCLIGRADLYGLMAGGPRGVAYVLDILAGEFRRIMQLLGARTIGELTPDLLSRAG